ncbi:MAG: amidohydrolase family protein [Thermoanaerobaculia bacterium]
MSLLASAVLSAALAFTNGQWFDGTRFVERTVYVVDGRLASRRPAGKLETIDLHGKFVVPPFGEAHNHNVEESPRLQSVIDRYLREGIFYVQNPNSLADAPRRFAGRVNTPASIDVTFSNGGLTNSDGHPVEVARALIARGVWKESDGAGSFYHPIDDRAALDREWPRVLAGRPDFIKTYLLFSEDFAARRNRPEHFGWNGLDPALLPEIVRRARKAKLRVIAHVETAADFRTAVRAGVNQIGHVPGFRPDGGDLESYANDARYRLTARDAKAAARHGVVVITTVAATRGAGLPIVRDNLRLLRDAGVRLAVGSDEYGDTSSREIAALRALGVFTNRELLAMWTRDTAVAIFPHRKVGKLEPGFEASFLVLDGDPLVDFGATAKIVLRVKDGRVLP